ncbi:hypothetical protein BABINDRAFT_167838 [Babjeviella inositovora NRRL Y-12698]|uniref:RING-CH-type domain-containing protein n=1 Tax=Babjeviella inositovora NRRL Y-12698 TaxID=984486 RepID=A0A1E3QLS1_9ASCO|nr:uncharacterized protein BABINDRAFT_167838 [Babjeviella inositovora NRRL Y-12698]ODQ78635.1 hypothetical protein BABINDRAFT_167838 [Babjeviella inositovora NRRL Y-12698]
MSTDSTPIEAHSAQHTDDDHKKCWICLGDENERPPLSVREEDRTFVQPCHCSLQAHRRCLLDWINSTDITSSFDNHVRLPNNAGWGNREFLLNITTSETINRIISGLGGDITIQRRAVSPGPFLSPSHRRSSQWKYVIESHCPQCKEPIFLATKASSFLLAQEALGLLVKQAVRLSLFGTFGASVLTGLGLFAFGFLTASGYRIMDSLAPPSVQLKLLGVSALGVRTLSKAIEKNLVPMRKIFLVTTLPLYVLSLRSYDSGGMGLTQLLREAYPFFYFDSANEILNALVRVNSGDPRNMLLQITIIRRLYDLLFKMTFNRLYYRWVRSVKPCFLADRFDPETLVEMERESEREQEIYQEQEALRIKTPSSEKKSGVVAMLMSVIRALNVFKDGPGAEKRMIRRHRRRREIQACWKTDFSGTFSIFLSQYLTFFTTTIVWPVVGQYLGTKVLSKLAYARELSNRFAVTPDDALWVRNLVGCCVVVVAKDVYNLYVSWKKVKQLRDIEIAQPGSPLYLNCIAQEYTTTE